MSEPALKIYREEAAKNLPVSATSAEAHRKMKETGLSIRRAKRVMSLLYDYSLTVPDGVIHLPKGTEIPLSGEPLVLPPNMSVRTDNGRVNIKIGKDHFYLNADELGDMILRGGATNPYIEQHIGDLDRKLFGPHQSIGSVVRNLKLVGYVATVAGFNKTMKRGKKKYTYERLYLTGKEWNEEEYKIAEEYGQLQVGSTPEMRDWLRSIKTDLESIQNRASKILFQVKALYERGINIFDL